MNDQVTCSKFIGLNEIILTFLIIQKIKLCITLKPRPIIQPPLLQVQSIHFVCVCRERFCVCNIIS